MKLEVHFEAIYDKRKSNLGNLFENEVVVKRASLSVKNIDAMETLLVDEGRKIFATDPLAAKGFNSRIKVSGLQLGGALFPHPVGILIEVKSEQTA